MSLARYLSKLGSLLNSSGQVPVGGIADGAVSSAKLASGAAVSNIGTGGITATQLATLVKPVGVSQTWTNVTASRSLGTTYTNSTGRPITVIYHVYGTCNLYVDGVSIALLYSTYSIPSGTFIVPSGSTYKITDDSMRANAWFELR